MSHHPASTPLPGTVDEPSRRRLHLSLSGLESQLAAAVAVITLQSILDSKQRYINWIDVHRGLLMNDVSLGG